MDRLGATENRIEFGNTADGNLTFEHLQIAIPTGCTMLSEQHVQISQGDRVLIVGEPGTGKTILFRAIAGLWPWGSGRIALPMSDRVMFMARQPYAPLGTLRAALAYPSRESAFKDEQFVEALQCTGLNRLTSSLDQVARWDKELSDDEQQFLVFSRISLHKPRWLVIDEVFDTLGDEGRERIFNLFKAGFKNAAIVYIGRPESKDHFFTRVLHLIKDPHGSCFIPDLRAVSGAHPTTAPAGRPLDGAA